MKEKLIFSYYPLSLNELSIFEEFTIIVWVWNIHPVPTRTYAGDSNIDLFFYFRFYFMKVISHNNVWNEDKSVNE